MRIGILQCDHVPPELLAAHGDYPAMFQKLLGGADASLAFQSYDLTADGFPASVEDCDAWLFTGSKWGVYDDEPWIRRAEDLVRALHETRRPTVGICFGHQLIAQALGGRVEKSARGWGVGIHRVRMARTDLPWMRPPAEEIRWLVTHQDQVLALPPGAELLAGHDFCPHGMFRLDDHMLGMQGHPEYSCDFVRALMDRRRERIGEETYRRGIESLAEPLDDGLVAGWIVAFLRQAQRAVR